MRGKVFSLLSAGLVLIALGTGVVGQEKSKLDLAIDRTFELSKSGDDQGAVDHLAGALAEAEKDASADKLLMAEGYFYLGRFQSNAEQLPLAEETLRRSIALNEAASEDKANPLKISAMELLGKVVGRQKRPANAVSIFNRVLQLQAVAKGRTHADRVYSMELMAITFESAGALRAAEYYWRTVLGIATDTGLPADDIAYWRKTLAENLDKQGKAVAAERVRGGEAVAEPEGALLTALEEGEALRKADKQEEAHAHFAKLRDEYAETAGHSILYLLVLKGLAETADQEKHAETAKIYEAAIGIEDEMYGLTPGPLAEFRYLAAREWAFDGNPDVARKWFDELRQLGPSWVNSEVAERQRAVEAIMAAASGLPGASEGCRQPAKVRDTAEILYAGYSVERAFARLGNNLGRVPALDCSLALAGDKVEEKLRFAALMSLGMALVETGQYERAASILGETRASAERAGLPKSQMLMLYLYGALAHNWVREFDEGFALLDQAEVLGGGLGDWDRLAILRARSVMLINATRYLEAEDALREALAVVDRVAADRVAFESEGADALSDFATVLTRAGRGRDALSLLDRIALPERLPGDASNHATLFFVGVLEARMTLRASLDRDEEAATAAEQFQDAALPVVDALLANPERNRIVAATMAATLNQAALAMVALGLSADGAAVSSRAAELVAGDASDGVRLLGAQIELIAGIAALSGGNAGEALPRFDRALAAAQGILPDDSDEMFAMWAGRGMARAALADPEALADLRKATGIAKARIVKEARFDDAGLKRTMRPSFESLIGAAWRTANP